MSTFIRDVESVRVWTLQIVSEASAANLASNGIDGEALAVMPSYSCLHSCVGETATHGSVLKLWGAVSKLKCTLAESDWEPHQSLLGQLRSQQLELQEELSQVESALRSESARQKRVLDNVSSTSAWVQDRYNIDD